MASITMASSFLGGSVATTVCKQPSTNAARRGVVMAKAIRVSESGDQTVKESNTNRRDLVFAVAAGVACSFAKIAMAEGEEPKRGTAAAKEKYAAVCVNNPTARICHY